MRVILIIFLSYFSLQAYSQEGGEVNTMEVVIEKDAEIALPESNRQFQRIPEEQISFNTLDLKYNTKILKAEVDPFNLNYKALDFEYKKLNKPRPNYVKFGLGNYNNSLMEGAYNLNLKEAGNYSIFGFYDRYGKGPVQDNSSRFSDLRLNFKTFHTFNKLSLDSDIDFFNNNFRFYGTPTGDIDILNNPSVNAQSFRIGLQLEANEYENIYFSVAPQYTTTNFFESGDSFNQESIIDIKAEVRKKSKKNEWSYGVGLNQKQVTYTTNFTNTRSQFDIIPFVGLRGDYVTIKTSMAATIARDSTNNQVQSNFFPSLDLTWNFDNQFTIYGSFSSGLDIVTLRDLQYDNIFLADSLDMKNRSILADVDVQVSKRLNRKVYMKFGASIELVENQYFLINSVEDFRQFSLIYDPGTFTKIDLNFFIDYQINKLFRFSSEIHYMKYNTSIMLEPYHLPQLDYNLQMSYQALNNLSLKMNVNLISGMTGRDVDSTIVNLDPILDLGISANYALNNNFDLFIETNNLLNKNYERYLNYPSLGINGKFGFIFRFK
ncbi:MAG: TonB-dependent receptor [Cyclobacteriaceae bacterium]